MNCCGKSKFVKFIWILIGLIILAAVIFSLASCSKKEAGSPQVSEVSPEKEILYYTCGMHPSVRVTPEEYNKGNVNCPICNMKLTPVYKEEQIRQLDKQRKILFYRHPMDPSITSKEPAKDERGADYIPVHEEAEEDSNFYGCGMEGEEHVFLIQCIKGMTCPMCGMPLKELTKEEADRLKGVVSRVKIKGDEIRLAGVKTEPVRKLHLYKEIRTVGRVAYDPQLVIAQEEFISSLKALDKIQEGRILEIKERALNLVESSKRKLRLLGLSPKQIKELGKTREVQKSLILPEKKMWIYGAVYEYELSWVKIGKKIKVTTASLPGEEFNGTISSLNPVLDPKTRSVRFRAEVENPDLKLMPEMYVDVVIQSMYISPEGEHKVLAVPREAVLDTGLRKIAWVDLGSGEFQGREVNVGPEATTEINGKRERYLPILKGLNEGELVVTRGNFLIDSQSQLTGAAAAAYGGALGVEEKKTPPVHQH